MAGMDPDTSFVPAVQAAFGADNVLVIKDAQGGQPIRRWHKEWVSSTGDVPEVRGDLYDRLMHKVDSLTVGKEFTTVTFVWMQGERDARESHGEVYTLGLEGVRNQLKSDLEIETINFVVGRLSDFDMENVRYPHWTLVRDEQVRYAESTPNSRWIDTDDLNDGVNQNGVAIQNDLHMSVSGYVEMGYRFAQAAIEVIREDQ